MPVEFVNAIGLRPPGAPAAGFTGPIDPVWLRRYARTIDEFGFDYTLIPYASASFDQYVVAATVLEATERLKTVVAVRPNTAFPTVAAQALATLDQISGGRAIVHIISGGSDEEQRSQGDYLDKPARYRRSAEFVEVLREVWTAKAPFSHDGEFYRFEDFGPGYATSSGGPLAVSLGGSSEYAYAAGAQADIFALWGEPLAETAEQIARVYDHARAAGRTDRIRFWVTFRPVVAATDELARRKAHELVERTRPFYDQVSRISATNVGTVRLREISEQAEEHDGGVLWTPRGIAGSGGASSLLVGSPETIAAALVKYVELGADVISLPTLGDLGDAIEVGREIIPLVREEVARRGIDPELTFRAEPLARRA
ncbi:LLM class flavin-dependent oxidoreductase [Microbacterium sp. SORGH_AS_0888]|uniref:LLM class flavin-dependent oxidoreductase n=1 Tax=Microbacterium sp. SORGH_AS_0888 TaxID=3041791 RepID=UPI00278ADEBD|nr:LLM class flavin-dependent oxidoreductase [Microbacterium sp. SORGH_AS_0888]MDQ1130543.1 alkanesulfonate monooxygenase [Microbacterium sp. SORGH_AS_0888]